jgi:CDGSH-type Zn-finger protein/truncated hemoglobin YjbI
MADAVTRRALVALLARASETEHGLACGCLHAAYRTADKGLARRLSGEAVRRMIRLAQLGILTTATGGTPALRPPADLVLEAPGPRLAERLAAADNAPYDEIAEVLRSVPDTDLVICPSEGQAVTAAFGSPLRAVTDRESALEVVAGLRQDTSPFPDLLAAAQPTAAGEGVGVGRAADPTDQGAAQATGAGEGVAGSGEGAGAREGAYPAAAQATANASQPAGAGGAAYPAAAQATANAIQPTQAAGARPAGAGAGADPDVAVLFDDCYQTMLAFVLRFLTPGEETADDVQQLLGTALRLMTSVLRPVGELLGRDGPGPAFAHAVEPSLPARMTSAWTVLDEQLWELARSATRLRVRISDPLLAEATAGLQYLACQENNKAGVGVVKARLLVLTEILGEVPAGIEVAPDGPYLVTNAASLRDWLGRPLAGGPQLALCRCGESGSKPFCDGSHVRIGFSGAKDPGRVPAQRDTYVGKEVTLTDDRGLCAHAGFCTGGTPGAFRAGTEPFVDADGAPGDDIVRAVRNCPSGALGGHAPKERPADILVSRDGPYRVTGSVTLTGAGELNPGGSSEHYSLCRCGHSQNKPFCSGMHWYVDFHDPGYGDDHEWTMFEWVGGLPALTRMTELFYEKYVPADPLVGPLFAHMSPDHPQRVAAWLGETFGGPAVFTDSYGGYPRMLSQHIDKGLTEEKRARWVELLMRSADEAGVPADPEFRSAFASYIEWGSRIAVENSTPGAHPPQHMPVPQWNWGLAGPPGSRVSALAPAAEEEPEPTLPAEDEPVGFADHVKPMFRSRDRNSMKWAFDLWAYEDVRTHADAVLARLRDGSMPCDGAWPPEKVAAFARWAADPRP